MTQPPIPGPAGPPDNRNAPPPAFAAQPVPALPSSAAISKKIYAWLVLSAGIAIVIGSFMPWVTVSGPLIGTLSAWGVDGLDGWLTVTAGLVLVLYGTVSLRDQVVNVVVPIVASLNALGSLALGVQKVIQIYSGARDLRADPTGFGEDDVFGIGPAISGATQVHVGNGVWLILFGGLIGSIAMLLLVIGQRRR
jgi:hypothetical protein